MLDCSRSAPEATIKTQNVEHRHTSHLINLSERDLGASTILVVDDLHGNRLLLKNALELAGFQNVVLAETAQKAFSILGLTGSKRASQQIDLILMDVMMPKTDGIEACRRINDSPAHRGIPVIMVSALTEVATLEDAFHAGAVDYLAKPINHVELNVRVRSALALKFAMEERTTREIEFERREKELLEVTRLLEETNERLRHLSTLDGLTGIPNRRRVMEFLDQEWRRSQRDGSWLSIVMIDVDYFKDYNDALGHQAGDDCLWMIANCLKRCLNRASDMVGRYGGEEFIAILPETPFEGAMNVGDEMRAGVQALNVEHPDSGVAKVVTISLGVASCQPGNDMTAAKLVSLADQALFEAKRQGRNRVVDASAARQPENPLPQLSRAAAPEKATARR